jgi:hypothetical protein
MTEDLKKLYALLNKVSTAILGSDPQMRKEYEYVKKQIIEKIKTTERELNNPQKNDTIVQ